MIEFFAVCHILYLGAVLPGSHHIKYLNEILHRSVDPFIQEIINNEYQRQCKHRQNSVNIADCLNLCIDCRPVQFYHTI